MKKWIVRKVYKLLREYITVDSWKSPITCHLSFTMRIFGEKVSEVEYSQREQVERIF